MTFLNDLFYSKMYYSTQCSIQCSKMMHKETVLGGLLVLSGLSIIHPSICPSVCPSVFGNWNKVEINIRLNNVVLVTNKLMLN